MENRVTMTDSQVHTANSQQRKGNPFDGSENDREVHSRAWARSASSE
jgi:hypothetical protein